MGITILFLLYFSTSTRNGFKNVLCNKKLSLLCCYNGKNTNITTVQITLTENNLYGNHNEKKMNIINNNNNSVKSVVADVKI